MHATTFLLALATAAAALPGAVDPRSPAIRHPKVVTPVYEVGPVVASDKLKVRAADPAQYHPKVALPVSDDEEQHPKKQRRQEVASVEEDEQHPKF
jgi:uncharacterized Zn-finger protein